MGSYNGPRGEGITLAASGPPNATVLATLETAINTAAVSVTIRVHIASALCRTSSDTTIKTTKSSGYSVANNTVKAATTLSTKARLNAKGI